MAPREFPPPTDQLLPPTIDVANLALALFHALDACYENLPAAEQWILRHTMLDSALEWENIVHEVPSLQKAMDKSTLALAAAMPGGLTTSLVAPVLVWGLTQDWVPNQDSMLNCVLKKWGRLFVQDPLRARAIGPKEHIHVMRSTMLLLDQLPFDVEPLVYARVMHYCAEPDYPHGAYKYQDEFAVLWVQWLLRIAMRAGIQALTNEESSDHNLLVYNSWYRIASRVFPRGTHIAPTPNTRANFESMLRSTLPKDWVRAILMCAPFSLWTAPQFVPMLDRLLSLSMHDKIAQLPWSSMNHGEGSNFFSERNKALASSFFPDIYPAVLALHPDALWHDANAVMLALKNALPIKEDLRAKPFDLNDLLA